MYTPISKNVRTLSICITDKKMTFHCGIKLSYILFNMNIMREHRVNESFSTGKLLYQNIKMIPQNIYIHICMYTCINIYVTSCSLQCYSKMKFFNFIYSFREICGLSLSLLERRTLIMNSSMIYQVFRDKNGKSFQSHNILLSFIFQAHKNERIFS